MRKLMLTATILLLGSLAGCRLGTNCGGGCGSGGCGSGGCAGGGCGAGGLGSGRLSHAHGICDCEDDDYCSSRSPWVRNTAYNAPPVETIQPPAKLPNAKKELE